MSNDRTCLSCKHYRVEHHPAEGWFLTYTPAYKKEMCCRLGAHGMSIDDARGHKGSSGSYHGNYKTFLVDGPCGFEGKYWEEKKP